MAYLPENYFQHSQVPLIRIEIPEQVDLFHESLLETADTERLKIFYNNTETFNVANITFYSNTFDSLTVVEPFIA